MSSNKKKKTRRCCYTCDKYVMIDVGADEKCPSCGGKIGRGFMPVKAIALKCDACGETTVVTSTVLNLPPCRACGLHRLIDTRLSKQKSNGPIARFLKAKRTRRVCLLCDSPLANLNPTDTCAMCASKAGSPVDGPFWTRSKISYERIAEIQRKEAIMHKHEALAAGVVTEAVPTLQEIKDANKLALKSKARKLVASQKKFECTDYHWGGDDGFYDIDEDRLRRRVKRVGTGWNVR